MRLGKIVVHAVAVQISPALAHVVVPQLHPVLSGIHVAEVTEAFAVEIGEALILHGVGVPVSDLGPEGVEDDVGGSDEGFHLAFPFVRVGHKFFIGDGSQVPVSPAVAGQFPAVVSQTLGQLADRLPVLLNVGVDSLVGGIGAVSHNPVVSGEGDDGSGSLVGEIRMLLDKVLQQGDQVVRAGDGGAVVQIHLAGGLAVLPDHQAAGKAIPFHIFIVADIILGHDERLFPLRQHNISFHKGRNAVFIRHLISHIVDAHQHVAPVVHGLDDLQKFIFGGHHLVIAVLPGVSVKSLGGVHDQGVEKYVGDFRHIRPYQSGFRGFVAGDGRLNFLLIGVFALRQKGDGGVVVIAHGQTVRLPDQSVRPGENL